MLLNSTIGDNMSKTKTTTGALKKAAAVRKARKAVKDAGATPVDAPPVGQAPVAADELEAMREYVTGLLQSKSQPSNPYVRDMVAELRKAEEALAAIVPRMQQLRQSLQQLAERRTAMAAISQQMGLQLYRWRDEPKGD